MSCDIYECNWWDGEDWAKERAVISFPDHLDTPCLCTFPHGYDDIGDIDVECIRSLAYLGASVVLLHHGEIEPPVYLPMGLPEWIRAEIDRNLPVMEEKP